MLGLEDDSSAALPEGFTEDTMRDVSKLFEVVLTTGRLMGLKQGSRRRATKYDNTDPVVRAHASLNDAMHEAREKLAWLGELQEQLAGLQRDAQQALDLAREYASDVPQAASTAERKLAIGDCKAACKTATERSQHAVKKVWTK